MNSPLKLFPTLQKFSVTTARIRNFGRYQKMICGLLAMTWPFAAPFGHASPSSQQSSSQRSSTQAHPPSQAQSGTPGQPPQKEDSLAEAARKAKAKKPAAAKGKVYTEDDLSGMKGPGVSVVGEAPKKGARRTRPTDQNGDAGENNEEYWRGRAQEILGQIAAVDEAMARMKDDLKKYGSGGFGGANGMEDKNGRTQGRNGAVKGLETSRTERVMRLGGLPDG